MKNNDVKLKVGDTCVMITNIQKRYTQEFEIKDYDGKYYTVTHGNSLHRVSPERMFQTREKAIEAIDTGKCQPRATMKKRRRKNMNRFEAERRMAQRMKDNYPPGTRIMLLSMGDDPRPVEDNTRGTVRGVDDMGTLHCDFDNGRELGIVPCEDSLRRLTDEELAEEQNNDIDEDSAPVMGM